VFLKGLVGYYSNWIPNFSLMAKSLYILLKSNLNPILWEEPDKIVFKALKESLFIYEKEYNAFGILTQKHENHHLSTEY